MGGRRNSTNRATLRSGWERAQERERGCCCLSVHFTTGTPTYGREFARWPHSMMIYDIVRVRHTDSRDNASPWADPIDCKQLKRRSNFFLILFIF